MVERGFSITNLRGRTDDDEEVEEKKFFQESYQEGDQEHAGATELKPYRMSMSRLSPSPSRSFSRAGAGDEARPETAAGGHHPDFDRPFSTTYKDTFLDPWNVR